MLKLYHEHGHLETSPRSPHGCDESPAVLLGVVTLDSPQTLLSVVAPCRNKEAPQSITRLYKLKILISAKPTCPVRTTCVRLSVLHYNLQIHTPPKEKAVRLMDDLPTCCNEFSIQGCGAQAGASIMHG